MAATPAAKAETETEAAGEETCRVVVMCSGGGTNLQALIDAAADGRIPAGARIVRVVVNRRTAYAVRRAEQAGIPTSYFNLVKDGFQAAGERDPAALRAARARYDAALAERVLADAPDLVVLAGWMHVFGVEFLRPLEDKGIKIINLHPALPGKYDGANAIQRAHDDFRAGRLENNSTGVMIHYVIAEVDRGRPLMTEEVECREGEELAQLEERMHAVEHELIVRATAQVVGDILEAKRRARTGR